MPIERGINSFKNLITRDIIFEIPTYQRNYSWEKKQLKDLWNDLFHLESGRKHFFGTILLRLTEKKERRKLKEFETYELIDGQQRIVTTLILMKTILSKLESMDKTLSEDIKQEKELYLKYDDLYKLKLLGDDETFFEEHIMDLVTYPDETLTPSQKRLKFALDFYTERVNQLVDSDILMDIKLKIDNMELLVYPTQEEADAARMFTIINDRGKVLTNLEKTKSFLMYYIYLSSPEEKTESDLKKIHKKFCNIFRNVMYIENSKRVYLNEDEIQRYHYIIYETDQKIKKLYKEKIIRATSREKASSKYMDILKSEIPKIYRENKENCRKYILDYIEDLEKSFIALKEIITYNENDKTNDVLNKIFSLGRIGNFYPLLIVVWIRFKSKKLLLNEILSLIEKFVFRTYVISRWRPYAARNLLYGLAYESKSTNENNLLEEIKDTIGDYINDEYFELSLKNEKFYEIMAPRDIKYLLFEYDNFLREKAKEPLDLKLSQILSRTFEVEHIWAQDTSNLGLDKNEKRIHNKVVHKLGNLTLASESWNKSMGNKAFSLKRKKYRESALRVQRELAKKTRWGKDQIDDREEKLIDFAMENWKIN